MKLSRVLPCLLACIALCSLRAQTAEQLPGHVIVLANTEDADSVRLAHYYAEKRGVPERNIFAYPMSRMETITWPEFVSTIWEPLLRDLVKDSWINAIAMDSKDAAGRRRYAVQGHSISFLVTCRGVPLRIEQDATMKETVVQVPMAGDSRMQVNQAAVDSELTVMAMSSHAAISYVPNPLFQADKPTFLDAGLVIKVSRLDGPSYEAARGLVDNALRAEKQGVIGRAYVDMGGPYSEGDLWFLETERLLEGLGFDTEVDRGSETFGAKARFDAPVLYFGWYAGDLNGPMALPGFRFPTGAVAFHLHSYSAQTLHDPAKGWCGPLVARGATATFGNVNEPYLALTHRPHLLLKALMSGACFGDAGFYAQPALSWQGILVGDPLYRPFKITFEDQWNHREALGSRLAGYLVLRKMRLLEAEGKQDEAIKLAQSEMVERPGLALALGLARRFVSLSKPDEAVRTLDFVKLLPVLQTEDWALLNEAAKILAEQGSPASACVVIDKLLNVRPITGDLRKMLLNEGIEWSKRAADIQHQLKWQKELLDLGV